MNKTIATTLGCALTLALSPTAWADTYQIYMPSTMPGMIGTDTNGDGKLQASEMFTNKNLIITNTDSRTVSSMSLTSYLQKSGADSYSFGTNDVVQFDGTSSNNRVYQDLKGTTLTIRENNMLQVRDKGPDGIDLTGDEGDGRYYDRILKLDVLTGAVTEEVLIAKSQSDYDYAVSKGYSATLEATGDTNGIMPVSLTTYSQNLTNTGSSVGVQTDGNFSTNKITSADGSSLFRQESDGTVHIGENSIVFADESVSASGTDEIYSSSGTLQLGNNASHQTNVKGNMDVGGNLGVAGGMDVGGNLGVAGGMDVGGNLGVGGNMGVGGDLNVTGQVSTNSLYSSSGTLQLGNNASHQTNVKGNMDVGGNLGVAGRMDVGGNLGVAGGMDVGGNLGVGGNMGVGGDLNVTGQVSTNSLYSSSGTLQLGNNASHQTTVRGSMSVQGTLSVADPTSPAHATTKRYVDGAVATALAMSAVPKAPHGGNMFGIATGYHGGQSAIAMGLSMHNAQRNMIFNLSAGYNTSVRDASVAAGVGWGF